MRKIFKKTIKQVAEMDRNELSRGRSRENKDPQTKLLTTRYSNVVPPNLNNNIHLISNDPNIQKFVTY